MTGFAEPGLQALANVHFKVLINISLHEGQYAFVVLHCFIIFFGFFIFVDCVVSVDTSVEDARSLIDDAIFYLVGELDNTDLEETAVAAAAHKVGPIHGVGDEGIVPLLGSFWFSPCLGLGLSVALKESCLIILSLVSSGLGHGLSVALK